MRWIALTLPLVLVCIGALLMSQQKVLWHVTEPGMTIAEARAALPEATPPAQPKVSGDGLSLGLVAANVTNLDRAFGAELYFGEEGLRKVVLHPTRLLAEQAAMMEFAELRQAASLRYGRELPGTPIASSEVPAQARWRAGPVTVVLQVERRGALAAVTMSYSTGEDRS